MWKGLYPVVSGFQKALVGLLTSKKEIDFPIDIQTIELDCLSFIAQMDPDKSYKKLVDLQSTLKNPTEKTACSTIMKNLTNRI